VNWTETHQEVDRVVHLEKNSGIHQKGEKKGREAAN
jgi:hypothetical protein